MTIQEIIAKLALVEGTESFISDLNKQVEILENKSKAVESKNTEIQDLKTKIVTLEANKTELNEQLEEIRTKWASQADWFKTLYEEKKTELNEAKVQIEKLSESKIQLENLRKTQEEKIEKEIEILYEQIPEEKRDFVKNMAERYPIEERISFISDFAEKFWKVNKKKWWKVHSNNISEEMDDAQKLFDEILSIPMHRRTHKQRKDLITLWKVLSWKIQLK